MNHPAKYTKKLMTIFQQMLIGVDSVLDPFAGTGRIHDLDFNTIGIEIEKEWADMHKDTIHGDSTCMTFRDKYFDAVCTSPTYGNRMADCHNAKDNSKRNTYTHVIGHKLQENNTGKMQWGKNYRNVNEKVLRECHRVLKDNGTFILNIKNHIRKGEEVNVKNWFIEIMLDIGFYVLKMETVKVNGNGFGANGKIRLNNEYVIKFIKH